MQQRTIDVTVDAPAVNRKEIAKILAFYITGGDPAGYLARLAAKEADRKADLGEPAGELSKANEKLHK